MRGPGAFDTAGHRVAADAARGLVDPAQALVVDVGRFRIGSQQFRVTVAVALAHRVPARGQCDGLLVVHRHPRESHAHVVCRLQRIGLAAHAFGIDVDQAHLHRGQRVLEGLAAFTLVAGGGQPLLFGTPVGVLLRMPDVLAAESEAEGLQAHVLVGDGAGEDDQVGPADPVAVFLLDRPQQATCLVEVDVVGPGVDRCEALVARAGAAAAIGDAVGAGGVPGHAHHQSAVMPPVRRPPVLAVRHQRMQVLLQRIDVELPEFFPVVEALAQRIGPGVVLMQDVEVQRPGPPLHVRHAR